MLFIFASFVLLMSGCGWASPDAGTEAVLIQKPWFFGHGGVDETAIKTGRTLVAITTDVVYVDMRPSQFEVHFDDFMSKDGVPLDFDAIIRIQVTDSVRLIREYGDNWYKVNIEKEFANRVRQAVRKHGLNEMAISTDATESVDAEVTEELSKHIAATNIPIKLVQITTGKANPPDSVKNQRIETATQQQRRLTETERKLAEDIRRTAETSRALADNAYREAMHITQDQFVQLEAIKMQREVCSIEGKCTFILGTNVFPVLQAR